MTKVQEFRKQTEEAKFEAFSLMCKKVADLEKENAELKEQNKSYEQLIDKGSVTLAKERLKNYKQLTKVKDLIKNIIRVTWGEGWNYSLDWKVKAEQFIKEIEE